MGHPSIPTLGTEPTIFSVSDEHIFSKIWIIAANGTISLAVNQYFTVWEQALYAQKSQPAISNLVSILNVAGAPPLTASSLLAALIGNFGLCEAVDQAFVAILPSGRNAKSLDTSQNYMSTQLAALLSEVLLDLSTNFLNGAFLFMVAHGQMMEDVGESLQRLESSLAWVLPVSEEANIAAGLKST